MKLKDKACNNILVSIVCTTYNHKNYIRDAIEGFLMQKCSFGFEVFIFDDASTDGTDDIIKEYAELYPNIIIPKIQSHNTFGNPERQIIKTSIYESCKGKYLVVCDGDDYWTDANKLQIQVDYMESIPECSLCMHNAIEINSLTGEKNLLQKKFPGGDYDLGPNDILVRPERLYATASMLFRKNIIFMEPFFYDTGILDVPLQAYAFSKGAIHYFNIPMSVYRYGHKNSWSLHNLKNNRNRILHDLRMIKFFKEYDSYTSFKYHNYIVARIQSYYISATVRFDCSLDKFIKECEQINVKTLNRFTEHINNIIERYKFKINSNYIPQKCHDFLDSNKNILVMGAGENAKSVVHRLENNGRSISGIVVSNGQKSFDTFMDLSVKEFKEIENINDYAIVISISPKLYAEIYSILEEKGITNYYYFYLIGIN